MRITCSTDTPRIDIIFFCRSAIAFCMLGLAPAAIADHGNLAAFL